MNQIILDKSGFSLIYFFHYQFNIQTDRGKPSEVKEVCLISVHWLDKTWNCDSFIQNIGTFFHTYFNYKVYHAPSGDYHCTFIGAM